MSLCLSVISQRLATAVIVATVLSGVGQSRAAAAAPPITAVAFTPDNTAVLLGSQAGIEVRSWPALEHLAMLPTELANIHDLAFSPDGKILAAAGGHPAEDGTVELFRWPEQTLLRRLSPHDDLIYAIAWRTDARQLATASADQRIGVYDIASASAAPAPARYLTGHSRAVLSAVFLPSQRELLTGGGDASLRLWDVDTGSTLRTLSNHTGPVHGLAVRPIVDLHALPMVASLSDDHTVRFWQPTIGRLVRFTRLESIPLAAAFSADGHMLWVSCKDGRLRAINPDDATLQENLPAIDGPAYALAVAADGSILVAGSNGQSHRVVLSGERK
jgi:WD40 repeat protein